MAESTVREEAPVAGPSLSEHTRDESDRNAEKQTRKKESSDEQSEHEEEIDDILNEHAILEVKIGQHGRKLKKPRVVKSGAKCEGENCATGTDSNVAQYIKYESNTYLCDRCVSSNSNDGNELVNIENEPSERVRLADMFVGRMRNESARESEFDIENVRVYRNVNVRHDLDDEKCEITGLCGLGDKKFGVIDRRNSCMKIYSSVTTKLLRYIQFGTSPFDATEVKVPHSFTQTQHDFVKTVNITESNVQGLEVESGHGNDISDTSKAKLGTETLTAVTIPTLKELWFIDTNKDTASIAMKLELDLACESIDFCEGQIFVLLRQDFSSEKFSYSVLILSSAGQIIKVIHNDDVFTDIHDMAVNNGVIYLTDFDSRVIYHVNIKGNLTRYRKFHKSCPRGICVDPRNNILFVCGYSNSTVYMLSDGLKSKRLSQDSLTHDPWNACFCDDKLFIGHYWKDSRRNYVDIIQLT